MATKKTAEQVKMIKVTLVKSTIACLKKQKENAAALGLTKVGDSNILKDNATVRGKIKMIPHLLKVEEVKED